jgi:hypothetical protein
MESLPLLSRSVNSRTTIPPSRLNPDILLRFVASSSNQKAPTPEEYTRDVVTNPFQSNDFYAPPNADSSPPEFYHPQPMSWNRSGFSSSHSPFQVVETTAFGGEDDMLENPYPSHDQHGYKYTPLLNSFEPTRSHTATLLPMPNMPPQNGDFSQWGYGTDPIDMRSLSVPNLMPSVETLLRPDWKSASVETSGGGQYGRAEEGGGGRKRSWPCIFKDCRKVYTTGAGLRYHLHNFHNSPSPRFINRPSNLFPCVKCKKSYVTKAGLRYHKSKTGHGMAEKPSGLSAGFVSGV